MRGLTAWEKFILLRMQNDAPDFIRNVAQEPREYWIAREQLTKDGRLQERLAIRASGAYTVVADISPKGREALRIDTIVNLTLV